MQPEQEKFAKNIARKSELLMRTVIRQLPPQPWRSPSDRMTGVAQCFALEKHVQTLQITENYQVNKTIVRVMDALINLVEKIQEIINHTGDRNSILQIHIIQQSMRIHKFIFVSELHRLVTATELAGKKV
jgi:hypothetical protein